MSVSEMLSIMRKPRSQDGSLGDWNRPTDSSVRAASAVASSSAASKRAASVGSGAKSALDQSHKGGNLTAKSSADSASKGSLVSRSNEANTSRSGVDHDQLEKVRRLKEARLREKQEQAMKMGKPLPKKPAAKPVVKKVAKQQPSAQPAPEMKRDAPKKKLNFKEIMAQANNVDLKKMEMGLKVKKTNAPVSRSSTRSSSESPKRGSTGGSFRDRFASDRSHRSSSPTIKQQAPVRPATAPTTAPSIRTTTKNKDAAKPKPLDFAKPMASITERHRSIGRQRSRDYDYSDEDDDGFIVDDDEEDQEVGDYRSEIRKLFDRGRKRPAVVYSDEDYDSADDMEATGIDIWQEESRSERVAKREDYEEQLRLERLAEEKRKRLKR